MCYWRGMADPETLVKEFCAAWARRDVEELLAYFADDAVYHNMPMPPVSGRDGIREILNLFVPPTEAIEFVMLNTAVRGNLVFTERVDRFTMGGRKIDLPVAGVFEIRNGKIAAWRDYFDMATWQRSAG
jgi:limonene-1,2-epoxide hydrolase